MVRFFLILGFNLTFAVALLGALAVWLSPGRALGWAAGGMAWTAATAGTVRGAVLAWPEPRSGAVAFDFAGEIEPLLERYCYNCHGDGMDRGHVVLDDFADPAELVGQRPLWERVHRNLEDQAMPPSDKRQPSPEERAKLIAWIESSIFRLDPAKPDPGRVTLRRLNREEYNNTVRDLVGVDLRPAEEFPEDDAGYGYDNIGDVLSLTPSLLERYVRAAAQVLDAAIVTEPPGPRITDLGGDQLRDSRGKVVPGGMLASNGTIRVSFEAPEAGFYEFAAEAGGSQAHQEWPLMVMEFEKGPKKEVRVAAPMDRPQRYPLEVELAKGERRRFAMSFTNDAYHPEASDPNQRDRNLEIFRVRVTGPMRATLPPPTEAHRALFAAGPGELAEGERARRIVGGFAERAYRRPLRAGELDRLLGIFQRARKSGEGFDLAVKRALQAALVSPHFLFRGEAQPQPDNPSKVHPVDEFALASRLSYFLWSSMPDEELFGLARQGRLRAETGAQIARMLADPKAEALTRNFAGQWLQLRNLRLVSPAPGVYPAWNDALREAMTGETEHFFRSVVRENRSVLEFLDARHTYLNETLARHYGIEGVKGGEFRRVELPESKRKERGGLLTQASILTLTSNPTRTSAVNRGKFILENFLGSTPPPPPEGVEIPPLESAKNKGQQTLRETLEQHRADPMCASCHARMDPIGFALEHFDGIGGWRDLDQGKAIDASGEMYTGESFEGPAGLRTLLVEKKKEAFVRSLAEQLLTYALGRGLEYYDKPALHQISEATVAGDYRFHALVEAIVGSAPFQKRRGDGSGTP